MTCPIPRPLQSLAGQELYSHHGDAGDCFDCFENENLAYKPEYASVVAALSKQLRRGWRGAAPIGAALHLDPQTIIRKHDPQTDF